MTLTLRVKDIPLGYFDLNQFMNKWHFLIWKIQNKTLIDVLHSDIRSVFKDKPLWTFIKWTGHPVIICPQPFWSLATNLLKRGLTWVSWFRIQCMVLFLVSDWNHCWLGIQGLQGRQSLMKKALQPITYNIWQCYSVTPMCACVR